MKLSDVKGERSLEVIADLIDLVQPITDDPEAAALFQKQKLPDGMTAGEFGIQWIKNAAIKLLKPHKQDIINIMSTIEGISTEEYVENLTVEKLIEDTSDLISDGNFTVLFFSAPQRTGKLSGSAQENTQEAET